MVSHQSVTPLLNVKVVYVFSKRVDLSLFMEKDTKRKAVWNVNLHIYLLKVFKVEGEWKFQTWLYRIHL